MISLQEKNLFEVPTNNGGKTKDFKAGSHLGVDFAYWDNDFIDDRIFAIQEGKIVDTFWSSTCGYSVVLQHDYVDGTHRFSGYIHLASKCKYNNGTVLKRGEWIGANKGNTGRSNGKHLHIYVSAPTAKAYNWDVMKSLCNFDPYPFFYKSKSKKYVIGSTTYDNMKWIEDYLVVYPSPVNRNEEVKQVQVLIDYLFMREKPNGNKYSDYCKPGIYNVLQEKVEAGYCWYEIAENFWVASGGTRTKDLLPKLSKEQELQNKIDELNGKIESLNLDIVALNTELKDAKAALEAKNQVLKNIASEAQAGL